jgi:hypothetical protein
MAVLRPGMDVQWCSGWTVREQRPVGLSLVHVVGDPAARMTRCGLRIGKPSLTFMGESEMEGGECKRCRAMS